MIGMFVSAAAQVFIVSLVVGAGLPALFAIGVRALAAGSGGDRDGGPAAPGASGPTARGNPLSTVFGICCFVLVIAAVALGITVIVAAGFGKSVSFEHIFPILIDK